MPSAWFGRVEPAPGDTELDGLSSGEARYKRTALAASRHAICIGERGPIDMVALYVAAVVASITRRRQGPRQVHDLSRMEEAEEKAGIFNLARGISSP